MKPSLDERGGSSRSKRPPRIYVSSELRISRNVPGLNWLSRPRPPRSPRLLQSIPPSHLIRPLRFSRLPSSPLLSSLPIFPEDGPERTSERVGYSLKSTTDMISIRLCICRILLLVSKLPASTLSRVQPKRPF